MMSRPHRSSSVAPAGCELRGTSPACATGAPWWLCCVAALLPACPVLAASAETDHLHDVLQKALADFDEGQQIQIEHPDRARALFRSAARSFELIADAGVVNGKLEFNLGNAHLQAGALGQAILHYRRAQRLIPRDGLLAENLKVARSRCLTTIRAARRSAFLRNAFFWHYETSRVGRTRTALAAYVLFWLLLSGRSFLPGRTMSLCLAAVGLLTLALGTSVAVDHWSDRNAPPGVVTRMDVVVRKGPGTGYQRQFEQPLQPGVEFALRSSRGGGSARSGWWNIELPDGQSGWIEAQSAALVPNDAPS